MNCIKLIFTALLVLLQVSFISCNKSDECEIKMEFRDSTGLDGCGMLLVINLEDEWRTLEPINLADFDIVPVDGLEVCGEFIVRPDLASICLVGEIVELTSLSLR